MLSSNSFLFPYTERVKMLKALLCRAELCVHIDEGWRHFEGEALEIRTATDKAFGAIGAKVYRAARSFKSLYKLAYKLLINLN